MAVATRRTAPRSALFLALTIALCCLHEAKAQQMGWVPEMPNWAKPLTKYNDSDPVSSRYISMKQNAALAKHVNATNATLDAVFYGDSITSLCVQIFVNSVAFESHFGGVAGWTSARMGMAGSTVEELTWRIMAGGEKFKYDPLITVLLIGTNNNITNTDKPWTKLEYLLYWMQYAMPRTRAVVVAPLPSIKGHSGILQREYRKVVARFPKAMFSTCGSNLNPRNKTLFVDGIHPKALGYRIYFDCLKKQLVPVRTAMKSQRALSSP